jgi:hypothetical protein
LKRSTKLEEKIENDSKNEENRSGSDVLKSLGWRRKLPRDILEVQNSNYCTTNSQGIVQ